MNRKCSFSELFFSLALTPQDAYNRSMVPIVFTNRADYRTGFLDLPPQHWESSRDSLDRTDLLSPPVTSPFPFREAIPSWNILCGSGGWAEIFLRGRREGVWTGWYPLGLWASADGPVRRSSFAGMGDGSGTVRTDTLSFSADMDGLQMKISLRTLRGESLPLLRGAALAWSTGKPEKGSLSSRLPGEDLPPVAVEGLPAHSQMPYRDGGSGWCSPTSVSMVLGYWRRSGVSPEACVREAAAGVYDPVYGGTGNWAFNTAWAGSLGYRAYLCRLTRFSRAVPYLEAGIPLVMSIAFDGSAGLPLSGAPMDSSRGHLIVLRGFDGKGRALVQEPAVSRDEEVPRSYDGAELEQRWLEASGGLCYVIRPENHPDPYSTMSQ